MASSLTNEEQYVIAYLKSDRVKGYRWTWFIVQCLTVVVFGYGLAEDDRAMIVTGFGTLFLLNVYTILRQPRTGRAIGSALTKLEAAASVPESSLTCANLSSPSHILAADHAVP